MKGFLKFFVSLAAVFAALVSALVLVDRYLNRNRIQGEYLNCDQDEPNEF